MKRCLQLLICVLAVSLIVLTTAFAAELTTVSAVNAALGSSASVTLTQDVNGTEKLTVPKGKTLDLAGHTLAAVGIDVQGTVVKNGGQLVWLVSQPTDYSIGTVNQTTHIFAAVNAANGDVPIDLIRLTRDVNASRSDSSGAYAKNYPNLTLSSNFPKIALPEGVKFDLAGYRLTISSISMSQTNITCDSSDEKIGELWHRNWCNGKDNTSDSTRLKNSRLMAEANPDVQNVIWIAGGNAAYDGDFGQTKDPNDTVITDAVIPANTILQMDTVNIHSIKSLTFCTGATIRGDKTINAAEGITFECANEKDFTRAGSEIATCFRLSGDITLTSETIDLGNRDFDFAGHAVVGGKIVTTGTVSFNGGGYGRTATNEASLRAAAADATCARILLGANVTLTSDVDLGDRSFDFGKYDLLGKTVRTTGRVDSSGGGGNIRTADTVDEFWALLNEMRGKDSKVTVLRLGADINASDKRADYDKYSNINRNGISGGTAYLWMEIPEGCELDLVGYRLSYRTMSTNVGTVTDSCRRRDGAYQGHLTLVGWATSGSTGDVTLNNAIATAEKLNAGCDKDFDRALVTEINISSDTVATTKDRAYTFPRGITVTGSAVTAKTLTFAPGARTAVSHVANIIYECETVSDFTRLFHSRASTYRLTADIRDDDYVLHVGKGQTLDLNGHTLFVRDVVLEEGAKITENGGARRLKRSAATAEELQSALTPYADVTLTADISAPAASFTVPCGAALDLNGHTLTCKSLSTVSAKVYDSTDGTGLLRAETAALPIPDSAFVPLSDGDGYRFFHVAKNVRRQPQARPEGELRFAFAFTFSNPDAYELILGGKSGLRLYVTLKTDDRTAAKLVFSDSLLYDYVKKLTAGADAPVLYFDLSNYTVLTGQVCSEACLANESLAVECRTAQADGDQTAFLPLGSEDLYSRTVGELKGMGEVGKKILHDAILRTAFAYYYKNPHSEYGMSNEHYYAKGYYTGQTADTVTSEGVEYETKITYNGSDYYYYGSDNCQFATLVSTRLEYGHRRPLGLEPEQVWADNLFVSQCSGWTYYVYHNAFRRPDGTPYEIYGGPTGYGGTWVGSTSSDQRDDINIVLWCNPDSGSAGSINYTDYNPNLSEELRKMSYLEPGDILYTAAHLMLCIGDYDNDGYIEYMHCWPVSGDGYANGSSSGTAGNLAPIDLYTWNGSKMSMKRPSGEHHETNGSLEIIYWKETRWDADGMPLEGKLVIDQPLSKNVKEEQVRITINDTAQSYLGVLRPLIGTVEKTRSGFAECMDKCTLSPAAQTRLRMDGLAVSKWLADESGEKMIYATHTLLPGQTATVRLQLANHSSTGYRIPSVKEFLPEGVTLVEGELEHTDLALNAGETLDLSYKVKVDPALPGGTTLTFPRGRILGLETREITIRVSSEIADAAKLAAITKTADLPVALQNVKGRELGFVNDFYSAVLGRSISLPATAATWISRRLEPEYWRGMISDVKNHAVKVYKPRADVGMDESSLSTAQKNSLKLAKLELPRTLIGRYLVRNTDQAYTETERLEGQTVRHAVKIDMFNRLPEVGWEDYYLPGDVILTVTFDNPIYFDMDDCEMDLSPERVEVYIYLGNGRCLKHTSTGTTIETFDNTIGQCTWNALFVALRPLTMKT